MRVKRLFWLCLCASLLLGLCGCEGIEQAVDTNMGTEIDPMEIVNDVSIHLRDKDLLYTRYDNTEVVTMYLTVSTGNEGEGTDHTWEEINTYSVYDYEDMGVDRYKVAGLLQVGNSEGLIPGELGYGQMSPNCTVQIRGQSSSRGQQKNYKISVKENKGDWRGQTTIALNKHQSDSLRFRNKLGFDLLSHIDELMGLRTTFVHLYVKDTTKGGSGKFEDYGLYTQVEQLNKTALKAHGLDSTGHLYKVNFCEFFRYEDVIVLKEDPRYDLKAFEEILEVKGNDDHTKLIRMLEAVNDYTVPIEQILDTYFDLENICYWMAFNLMVGNVDTQSRNFYLYSPQNTDRWYLLPWDLDGMLMRYEYELRGRQDYESWESGVSNYWGNVFLRRCLKSETFRAALDDAVEDLRGVLSPELINSYVDDYTALVKPYVYRGRDLLYAPLSKSNYDRVANGLNAQIADNYERYRQSFSNPMPFYIGVPEKTESGYTLGWEGAYDFGGEDITYTVELSKTCTFSSHILKQTGLDIPVCSFGKLPAGQYFVRVTAQNESGRTQHAFDCYWTETGKVYGTKSFHVTRSGDIVEDLYVE